MKEQGLQKLTVEQIVKQKTITKKDIEHLTDDEYRHLNKELNALIENCEHGEEEAIINKCTDLYSESKKNEIYERNHQMILHHLHSHLIENGVTPSTTQLHRDTGLSRVTITKHLKEYQSSELVQQEKARQQMMSDFVLNSVYRMAMRGDLKACKLFLQFTKQTNNINKVGQYVDKQQNNYASSNDWIYKSSTATYTDIKKLIETA